VAAAEAKRIYGDRKALRSRKTPTKLPTERMPCASLRSGQEFRSPDFDRLKQILKTALIFRRPESLDRDVGRFGFTYYAIGQVGGHAIIDTKAGP